MHYLSPVSIIFSYMIWQHFLFDLSKYSIWPLLPLPIPLHCHPAHLPPHPPYPCGLISHCVLPGPLYSSHIGAISIPLSCRASWKNGNFPENLICMIYLENIVDSYWKKAENWGCVANFFKWGRVASLQMSDFQYFIAPFQFAALSECFGTHGSSESHKVRRVIHNLFWRDLAPNLPPGGVMETSRRKPIDKKVAGKDCLQWKVS